MSAIPEAGGEGDTDGIRLRRATIADSERLFRWRNHEAVRQHSGNPAAIPWDTHTAWLARTLTDPTRVLLIGERHFSRTTSQKIQETTLEPVGVLRYDLSEAETEACVSIYLTPERMGQGLGAPLLRAGSAWVKEAYPSLNGIRAAIRSENIASLRTFERAGYQRNKAKALPAGFQEYVYLF